MKGTKTDEEEFEMLLGEIPRATSAPPHLEELQRVNNKSPKAGKESGPLKREGSNKSSVTDTYEDFYESYHGVKNVSVSSAGNIHAHSPHSNGHINSFYSSLSFDSPRGVASTLLPENERSPSKAILHQQKNMEHEEKQSPLSIHKNGVALPTQQFLTNDQSLASAFGNLSFREDGHTKHPIQAMNENGGFGPKLLEDGIIPSQSNGAYPAINTIGVSIHEPFTQTLNSVGPEISPHTLNHPSSQATMSAPFEMHGVKFPAHLKNHNVNGREMDMILKQNSYNAACGTNLVGQYYDRSGVLLDHQGHFPLYPSGRTLHDLSAYQILPSSSMHDSGAEFHSSVMNLQPQYYADSQIGSYLERQHPPFSSLQQVNPTHLAWHGIEDEKRSRMNQQYILLQQAQAFSGLPSQAACTISGSINNIGVRPQVPVKTLQEFDKPLSIHQSNGRATAESDCTSFVPRLAGPLNHKEFPLQGGNISRYNSHGFCANGESYPFADCQMQPVTSARMSGSLSLKGPRMVTFLEQQENPNFPEKILTRNRSRGVNSITTINPSSTGGRKKDSFTYGHGISKTYLNGQYSSGMTSGSFQLDIRANSKGVPSRIPESELMPKVIPNAQQQVKYNSLEEVQGRIYLIAKDQHGCRFLQKKFEEGSTQDVHTIFVEIIDHIIELMTDPFGNYLVQKLLEVCNEDQRLQILLAVTGKPGELVNISLNMHGTRAVQRLIETLQTPEQISLVIKSLKSGVVTLIKDLNGNHVVQRCLQCLSDKDNQFLFDAAAKHCVEIATHRHGCCVLQRCIDHSDGLQRDFLVSEIAANGLELSQDQFGNYVVQYILEFGIPWATAKVITQLKGHYAVLSMQKFSSNVVEKCLKEGKEELRAAIIQELLSSSQLGELLQDAYGNYVVQSALGASKNQVAVHAALVEAIRPHLPTLRSCPYGKRILSRTNLKK
ncbi:uncharacterized protein LOC131038216 [Cryptomeria japonica]|uniref:uncharacterized protein LOC131038216 n=1 Tax=Cryptomeria japonica TaxID=3369 RepID=UPI0027DA49FF|nr:uncharacterized protein LOC131038216 [Cryptomeria japonica]